MCDASLSKRLMRSGSMRACQSQTQEAYPKSMDHCTKPRVSRVPESSSTPAGLPTHKISTKGSPTRYAEQYESKTAIRCLHTRVLYSTNRETRNQTSKISPMPSSPPLLFSTRSSLQPSQFLSARLTSLIRSILFFCSSSCARRNASSSNSMSSSSSN